MLALLPGGGHPALAGGKAKPARTNPQPLSSALHAELTRLPHPQTVAAACVIDLRTGSTVFTHNADAPLLPASNTKVFVMAAALKVLGAEFRFQTRLATDGTNLYLIGDGDPGLGDPKIHQRHGHSITSDFEQWADALKTAGQAEFSGRLVIDESIFDDARVHPSWEPDDLGKWFAAPVGGLNFNDNCVDITLTPTLPGRPVSVSVLPRCPLIEIENSCRTGPNGQPVLHHVPGTYRYTIRGTCNKKWPFTSVPVSDPGLVTAETLRAVFAERGVRIAGPTERRRVRQPDGSLPTELTLLAVRVTPLAETLERAGKDSQNLFADCLLKRTAYEWARCRQLSDPQGSWALGQDAVRAALRESSVSLDSLVVADGSGLSRDNRCTARQLAAVLAWMHTQREAELLRASLSVAGEEGSLRKRLKDMAGRVLGKTGTMKNVRTLSGYVLSKDGPTYAFAVMFNGYPGGSGPYREIQDRICRILADQ